MLSEMRNTEMYGYHANECSFEDELGPRSLEAIFSHVPGPGFPIRFWLFLLVPIVLCVGDGWGAARIQAGKGRSAPPFSLTLTLAQTATKGGGEVKVKVVLTNTSDHEIEVWRENREDQGGFSYKVDVWDERAVRPSETRFGRALRGRKDPAYLTPETPIHGSGGDIPVRPGKSQTDYVNVSKLYDLSKSGKYAIQVERFDPETKRMVISNKITVTVASVEPSGQKESK